MGIQAESTHEGVSDSSLESQSAENGKIFEACSILSCLSRFISILPMLKIQTV